MAIANRIAEFHDEMTAWRRDFHQHPEIGYEEVRTSGIIADKLREFGVDEVVTGIAKTGVVGVIHGASGKAGAGKAIGLRADIDALPILEETGLPYASKTPGTMHACGHDGHTTMLLGAAKYLAETRNFDGTVYVIFQPAEENLSGGEAMVQEGLFQRFPMQRVFGMHNWPSIPAGEFAWHEGPVMAAVSNLEVTIRGRGAHGAMPQFGNDPVVIAAALVQSLQTVVSRNVAATDAAVITIGHIQGGDTWNVIPETVTLRGTARYFDEEVGRKLEQRFLELAAGIPAAYGATSEARFIRVYPATINNRDNALLARDAAEAVVGAAKVKAEPVPSMGGEDFSFMLNAMPGAYLWLGGARTENDPKLHHPKFDFNDEILPVGASYWSMLAERLLPR